MMDVALHQMRSFWNKNFQVKNHFPSSWREEAGFSPEMIDAL